MRRAGYRPEGFVVLSSLFRFLVKLGVLAGLVFAGLYALTIFVEPVPREMSVSIPSSKLQPPK